MIFSHLLLKNESGLTIDSLQKKKELQPYKLYTAQSAQPSYSPVRTCFFFQGLQWTILGKSQNFCENALRSNYKRISLLEIAIKCCN